jgi:hypothetical protein
LVPGHVTQGPPALLAPTAPCSARSERPRNWLPVLCSCRRSTDYLGLPRGVRSGCHRSPGSREQHQGSSTRRSPARHALALPATWLAARLLRRLLRIWTCAQLRSRAFPQSSPRGWLCTSSRGHLRVSGRTPYLATRSSLCRTKCSAVPSQRAPGSHNLGIFSHLGSRTSDTPRSCGSIAKCGILESAKVCQRKEIVEPGTNRRRESGSVPR